MWSMSCAHDNKNKRYIVFTTLCDLILVKYDPSSSFKMKVCDRVSLFSDSEDNGKKPVRISFVPHENSFIVLTCDDSNDLLLFSVTENEKLMLGTTLLSNVQNSKEHAQATKTTTAKKQQKQKKNIKGNKDSTAAATTPSEEEGKVEKEEKTQKKEEQEAQDDKVVVPDAKRMRDLAMSINEKATEVFIAATTEDNMVKAWKVSITKNSDNNTSKSKKEKNNSNSSNRGMTFEYELLKHSASHLSKVADGKQRLRNIAFSKVNPNLFYALHTSRMGQPHVTVYDIRDAGKIYAIKVHNNAATDFSVGSVFVAEDKTIVLNTTQKSANDRLLEREFLSFGIKNGLVVREVVFDESKESVNRLVAVGEYYGAHTDPITCNNILLTTEDLIDEKASKRPILRLASGSIDRSVGFRDTPLRSPFSLQLIMFAIVLLVSMLVFALKSIFMREHMSSIEN